MAGNAALNILKLFPWPESMIIHVPKGQLGQLKNLTWAEYMEAVGNYWDNHSKYPRHQLVIDNANMSNADIVHWGTLWATATIAMIERGYLNPATGEITPPPMPQ